MNQNHPTSSFTQASNINSHQITISANENSDDNLLTEFYTEQTIQAALTATLEYVDAHIKDGLELPYFAEVSNELWQSKPKALDVYITDVIEGREINMEARGKDYATNILSYPSEIPASVIELMPTVPLGELIICHDVLVREADEQNKALAQHITHLLIHGILHLLGFDHELGQAEQNEMERFEIAILEGLGLANPY